jgi:Mrp family chromosome partitioning ATPase
VLLREDAKACRDRLRYADLKIFGLVLNRYRDGAGRYGKRYRYYDAYEEPEPADKSPSAA